jgi:hypothetical protein
VALLRRIALAHSPGGGYKSFCYTGAWAGSDMINCTLLLLMYPSVMLKGAYLISSGPKNVFLSRFGLQLENDDRYSNTAGSFNVVGHLLIERYIGDPAQTKGLGGACHVIF